MVTYSQDFTSAVVTGHRGNYITHTDVESMNFGKKNLTLFYRDDRHLQYLLSHRAWLENQEGGPLNPSGKDIALSNGVIALARQQNLPS